MKAESLTLEVRGFARKYILTNIGIQFMGEFWTVVQILVNDCDLHWSNSMEFHEEALNLWSASEIRCSLFMPRLRRMLFGMLCAEGIFATETTSSFHMDSLYIAPSRGLIFLLSDIADRKS